MIQPKQTERTKQGKESWGLPSRVYLRLDKAGVDLSAGQCPFISISKKVSFKLKNKDGRQKRVWSVVFRDLF